MSEAVDLGELKRKSVRGGVVTMASQGLGIAIQLASTVVLGRLLSLGSAKSESGLSAVHLSSF